MAKARTYKRDSNGRFSSTGSARSGRPATRMVSRGVNRLTRDNTGRITGTGDGATARGGRLRTASGKQRGAVVARLKGTGGKLRRPIGGGGKGKVKAEQRAIASALKKEVRSKNIQASRILMKMAAKDGHLGSVKDLTSTKAPNSRGGWKPVPTRSQRGNAMSAGKSKELMFDRGPSRRLMRAAMSAADAGFVSHRRLDAVFKAAGLDYFSEHKGYFRAVQKAKESHSRRRRR